MPNFEMSYKHIMRFQLDRAYRQLIETCKSKISTEAMKMLSKTKIENIQI
jgi:hypothetical protein